VKFWSQTMTIYLSLSVVRSNLIKQCNYIWIDCNLSEISSEIVASQNEDSGTTRDSAESPKEGMYVHL
jgi:hypothetical protein